MPTIKKSWLRLAILIHAQLVSRSVREPPIEMHAHSWDRCTDLAHQIRRAQLRGWHLAASSRSKELAPFLPSIQRELTLLQQRASPVVRTPAMSAGEIYNDLVALQEEF